MRCCCCCSSSSSSRSRDARCARIPHPAADVRRSSASAQSAHERAATRWLCRLTRSTRKSSRRSRSSPATRPASSAARWCAPGARGAMRSSEQRAPSAGCRFFSALATFRSTLLNPRLIALPRRAGKPVCRAIVPGHLRVHRLLGPLDGVRPARQVHFDGQVHRGGSEAAGGGRQRGERVLPRAMSSLEGRELSRTGKPGWTF